MAPTDSPPAGSPTGFQPANTLANRTFIGLLVAQFLAAFNDQAIHASAMFFAFKTHALNEAQAISLMPILFYAPWAIFCTLAGYYADKYSKRNSLVVWKFAEVAITAVAMVGFYIGTHGDTAVGTWIVLSTVFLMGTHSAFFVPAKYGVMPEILQPHLLSKGNGILESLSFLAVILGTVAGGVLSEVFSQNQEYIGVILLTLAVIGAVASLLIRKMPAADPHVRFPRYIFGPLVQNLKTLFASKPLRLAVIGIAFFTFVVAFMRQTIYMLGESQNPRWGEQYTSLIVGTVALGIGIGSPLAGWLSGRKVELGLIPIGGVGMLIGCLVAAMNLSHIPWLIGCIVLIGFMTGFYLVPMYTLLQFRAPKSSKGNMIATSNFINVTGAIASSLLFFVLVTSAKQTGFLPEMKPTDMATGVLDDLAYDNHGQPAGFRIVAEGQEIYRAGKPRVADDSPRENAPPGQSIHMGLSVKEGERVTVGFYQLRDVRHYVIRPEGDEPDTAYDMRRLPQFLFIGAGVMTLLTLFVLVFTLRDLISRSFWFLRSLRRPVRVDGLKNLPGSGMLVLATNTHDTDRQESILSATDRYTRFFPVAEWANEGAAGEAARLLKNGDMIGVTVGKGDENVALDAFLRKVQNAVGGAAEVVPVFCGHDPKGRVLRVVFGERLPSAASAAEIDRKVMETQRTPME